MHHYYQDAFHLVTTSHDVMNFDIPSEWGSVIHIAIGVPERDSHRNVDTDAQIEEDVLSSDSDERVNSERNPSWDTDMSNNCPYDSESEYYF